MPPRICKQTRKKNFPIILATSTRTYRCWFAISAQLFEYICKYSRRNLPTEPLTFFSEPHLLSFPVTSYPSSLTHSYTTDFSRLLALLIPSRPQRERRERERERDVCTRLFYKSFRFSTQFFPRAIPPPPLRSADRWRERKGRREKARYIRI